MNRSEVKNFHVNALVLFPLKFKENVVSFSWPLQVHYRTLCPHFIRLKAEEVPVKEGILHLFRECSMPLFFKIPLHFGFSNKNAMISLPKLSRITNEVSLKHGWMPLMIC